MALLIVLLCCVFPVLLEGTGHYIAGALWLIVVPFLIAVLVKRCEEAESGR